MNDPEHRALSSDAVVTQQAVLLRSLQRNEGAVLFALHSESGVRLDSQEGLLERVQCDLAGSELVVELVDERREASAREDLG